jgi:cyanate permease
MILASLPIRFASGFITDRLKINQMRFFIGGAYLLQAIGFAVFLLNPESIFMLYIGLILYGMGTAASFMFNVMVGRYYGRKAFGSIRGVSMTLATPVGVAAPIYAGWVYDTTGSYITAFSMFAILIPLSAVLVFLARPPKPPARITDVRKFL